MLDAEVLPYQLIREAGLDYQVIQALRAPGAVAAADQLADLKGELRELADVLCDSIHGAVPEMTRTHRRMALLVRRALFNGRPVCEEKCREWAAALPGSAQRDLRQAVSLWRQIAATDAAGARSLASEVQACRDSLRGSVGESLLQGVQLSGEDVLDTITCYAGSAHPAGKRDRKTERTLLGYVLRMALKPSPFGSFAGVYLGLPGASGDSGAEVVTRLVRVNRLITVWLKRALLADPSSRARAIVRLNSTARAADGRVRYFSRGPDGTPGLIRAERFGDLPLTRPVQVLLRALAQGPVVLASLLAAAPAERQAAWQTLVDQLIRSGLVECDLDIADQEPDVLPVLARHAGATGTAAGTQIRDAALRLAALEEAFAGQPVRGRTRILREIREVLRSTATALNYPIGDLAEARALVFEDVGGVPPRPMVERAWEAHLPDLRLVQRLLPLFSDTLPGQVALNELFREEFGPTGRPDLLDAYQWYSSVPGAVIDEFVRSGRGAISQLRKLKCELFDYLDGAVGAPESAILDREVLARLASSIPGHLARWRYVSWNVQTLPGDDAGLVINGVGMGYGRQFGRFCPLFDSDLGNPLAEAIRAAYAPSDAEPVAVDILGTFGINVNIRPPLLPGALLYPHSKGHALSLRDCFAYYDERAGNVRVHSRTLGRDVIPVPQNPLFPALAPPLFQFLAQLGPGEGTTLPIWDHFHVARGAAAPRRYPRLVLGRTVVQRATWKLAATSVPDTSAAADDFGAFAEIRRWWRGLGLPDAVFARMHVLADPLSSGATAYSARSGLAASRLKRPLERKPQFIDSRSPLVLSMLASVANGAAGLITLQEFLPDDGGDRAREYVIETRLNEREVIHAKPSEPTA